MSIFGGGGGGGGGDAPRQKSATQEFLDQVRALPKAYELLLPTYKEYEPQFLQQSLDIEKQFSPQFAQLNRDVQEQVNPEGFGALRQLSDALESRGDLTSLAASPEMLQALQQGVRKGQFARGVALSPISAVAEAVQTLPLRIGERDKWINLAKSLTGRAGVAQTPDTSSTGFGSMGAPQVSSMTSLQMHANQLAFDRYSSQQSQSAGMFGGFGKMIGGLGGTDFSNIFGGGGSSFNTQMPTNLGTSGYSDINMGSGFSGGNPWM